MTTTTSNDLRAWFDAYKCGPGVHKWMHYFDCYDTHFHRFRDQEHIVIVEVGVQSGGSIEMWRQYFGPDKVRYYGVDINPATKKFEKDGVRIFIGDQASRTFWNDFKEQVPDMIDIFMDDGGHQMQQQIVTLEEMFWRVKDGGVYMCEDLHTSYWADFQGGYLKKTSMIERCKSLIDRLNARHSKDKKLFAEDEWTRAIRGIHFYDSLVFIDKGPVENVRREKRGNKWIPYK